MARPTPKRRKRWHVHLVVCRAALRRTRRATSQHAVPLPLHVSHCHATCCAIELLVSAAAGLLHFGVLDALAVSPLDLGSITNGVLPPRADDSPAGFDFACTSGAKPWRWCCPRSLAGPVPTMRRCATRARSPSRRCSSGITCTTRSRVMRCGSARARHRTANVAQHSAT